MYHWSLSQLQRAERFFLRLRRHSNASFSQEGEDLILNRILRSRRRGVYVDIGAHHPTRFSNTYLFYLRGWRGLNVDAMPGSMAAFDRWRPEDVNVEAAVSDRKEILTYYAFNEPALNGFSKDIADARDGQNGYHVVFQQEIETTTLGDLLKEHLPKGKSIDFLSIDVEGLDERVLRSNDWNRYRPRLILVEQPESSAPRVLNSSIAHYLTDLSYELCSKTVNTAIYQSTMH